MATRRRSARRSADHGGRGGGVLHVAWPSTPASRPPPSVSRSSRRCGPGSPRGRGRRPADRRGARRADAGQRDDVPADPGRAAGPRPAAAPPPQPPSVRRSSLGRPGTRLAQVHVDVRGGDQPVRRSPRLAGDRVRPTVTESVTGPADVDRRGDRVRSRSTRSSSSSSPRSSVTMTNSSPPKRAVVSPAAHLRLEPPGDDREHLVAERVAERVVDRLEGVEVAEQHRARAGRSGGPRRSRPATRSVRRRG